MKIIGAGLAGLLAARLLKHHSPVIHEVQPELPNNHSAVLRFRTDKVAVATGIKFEKVKMIKHYIPWLNPVADSLSYARKVSGVTRSDRSITSASLEPQERWIAPPDLVQRLAEGAEIKFNEEFEGALGAPYPIISTIPPYPIISTIPMSALMKLLKYPHIPEFKSIPGCNLSARLKDCDAYVSVYVPDPAHHFSRISITGDELIVEFPGVVRGHLGLDQIEEVTKACAHLGLVDEYTENSVWCNENLEEPPIWHSQQYSKILPIDEGIRKHFMHWATVNFNVYSLGRYATWRPTLLLDDLVKDIALIDKWITEGNQYGTALQR
jgi:hypothetical protein